MSLISAPTADKPFGHTYTVSRLGNVFEDHGVRYLNLPPTELKRVAIAQLRDNLPVWFGCDVIQSYLRDEGIMDTAALDVDALFGFPVEGNMDKAERLDYGESLMTHAMVLEGVRLDEKGEPTLWKVEIGTRGLLEALPRQGLHHSHSRRLQAGRVRKTCAQEALCGN